MTDTTISGRLEEFARRASLADLNELASFVHVTPETALGWINGGTMMKGETILRIQHYLIFKGLEPSEVRKLPEPAFRLSRYIALEVIGVEEARVALNYTNTTGLYRVLQGSEPTADRVQAMHQLLDKYEEMAAAALQQVAIVPWDDGGKPIAPAKVEEATPQPEPQPMAPLTPAATTVAASSVSFSVQHVTGSLLTSKALLDLLILTDRTQLAQVRELLGEQQLSELTEILMELVTQ